MTYAIIGLGTNMGDRQANLEKAVEVLEDEVDVDLKSGVYDTAPIHKKDQDRFLNQVVGGETSLDPKALLKFVKKTEKDMGREKTSENGPRVIDIDILFYGSQVVKEEGLEIPHPRIAERLFVLKPLNDIVPELVHPVLGKKVGELLVELGEGQDVKKHR